MSINVLKLELEERISQGQEVSRNKQLKTALNQLVKHGLINDSNIDDVFSDALKLKVLIKEYESRLIAAKKKELRSPLTHARNLAVFYTNYFAFDADGMSFSQAFKAAFHRKYSNIYEGEISPKERVSIKKDYITYRSIANDIVKTGAEKCPEAWPVSHAGAAAHIVCYVHGYSMPTVNVPMARLEYFEDYFAVPRGTFINKLKARMNWNYTEEKKYMRKRIGNKNTNGDVLITVKELSPSLRKYSDEYSAFKIRSKQPEVRNIPPAFIGREEYLEVFETSKRTSSKWTYNEGSKKCRSLIAFNQSLIAFMTFCVNELGMVAEEITVADLTNYKILEKWKNHLMEQGWGASVLKGLLNQIKRSSQPRGYLRLCGELGDRNLDRYFADLDFFVAMEPAWNAALDDAVQDVDAKENVHFLLDMKPKKMWGVVNNAIQWSLDHAKNLINSPARDYVSNAYNLVQSLTILHLSRIQPLREDNWSHLLLNEDERDFNSKEASLTWVGSRDCYRIYVPVGVLKNRGRKKITAINVYLPSTFNDIINNYLKYRTLYIDKVINKCGLYEYDPKWFMPRKHREADGVDPNNVFADSGSLFGARFKIQTKLAFRMASPEIKQIGLNHHATRHLAATWYLNTNPDDFRGLCAILGDSLPVILKTYAEINEEMALEKVGQAIASQELTFEF